MVIHQSVILGAEGMSNQLLQGKLLPNRRHEHWYRIGHNVEIGPYSIIHRGSYRDTVVGDNCKLGCFVNVGHNAIIGKNCLIVSNAVLGGSCEIGANCWIGMNATIFPHVIIPDYTVIGGGTVVVKSIVEPGIYIGNPARYLKLWDKITQPF